MRAHACVCAVADGDGRTRLARLRSQAPLLLRPTAGAVHLVSGAGGPLGGDETRLDIEVGPGASLVLHSVAATIALPGRGGSSALLVRASVGPGGRLGWLVEPTVVADGADHRSRIAVELADGAALELRDEVVLGRSGEVGGRVRSAVHVTAGGNPVLRSELVLDGADAITRGPALLGGNRCAGTLLTVGGPDGGLGTGWVAPGCAGMPLAGRGFLVSAVAPTAPELRRRLETRVPATAT